MSNHNHEGSHIEKLKGSENYHTWRFAMESMLEFYGMENCIANPCTETDVSILKKAKARIVLSVNEALFVHIQMLSTASEIWAALKNLYDDHGLTRQISLLRKLITVRLENCDSMSEYVNEIIGTANKLQGVGFSITEEWIGAILLAGLSDEFKPLIMGIESSGIKITSDAIKSKLLDGDYGTSSKNALFSNNKKNNTSKKKSNIKCSYCGKRNHRASECYSKQKSDNKSDGKEEPKGAFRAVYLSSQENKTEKFKWYIDSGATHHMTHSSHFLSNVHKSAINEITAANNGKMKVTGMGNATLLVGERQIEVKDILLVPELTANLLSVTQIVKKGNSVIFNNDGCSIYNGNNELLLNAKLCSGVYKLENSEATSMLANVSANDIMTWHRRLGHINIADLRKMKTVSNGIEFNKSVIKTCEACIEAKMTRAPFKSSISHSQNLLELVHTDLCGPMENVSIGGAKYFLTFIDDCSRKIFVYFLKSKDTVLDYFREFKQMVELQTGEKIKVIRSDNGKEYCSQEFEKCCKKFGIIHQTSNTYTPQQNGIAERANRTIVEKAKCMLFDAKMDKSYWAEAVNTAVYLINRSLSSTLVDNTPEGVWTGKKVNLGHLKIFGSNVMMHIPKPKRKKWDKKCKKMIFVGYSETTKGYRCINANTKKIEISRDVVFMEPQIEQSENVEFISDEGDNISVGDQAILPEEIVDEISSKVDTTVQPQDEENIICEGEIEIPNNGIRRSQRIPIPTKLKDFVYIAIDHQQQEYDPLTLTEAISIEDSHQWNSALEPEIGSIEENNRWNLVELSKNRKATKYEEEANVGIEQIRKVEVYYCKLCRMYLPRVEDADYTKILWKHCKQRTHMQRYRYKEDKQFG